MVVFQRFIDLAIDKAVIIHFLNSFDFTVEEKIIILNSILKVIEHINLNRKHNTDIKKSPYSVFKELFKNVKMPKKLFNQLYSAYNCVAIVKENEKLPKPLIKIKNNISRLDLNFRNITMILFEYTEKYFDVNTIYAKYQNSFSNIDEEECKTILEDIRFDFSSVKKHISSKVLDVLASMEEYNIIHDKIVYYNVFDYTLTEKKKFLIICPHISFFNKLLVEAIESFDITIVSNDIYQLSIFEKRVQSIPNFHCVSMERYLYFNDTLEEFDYVLFFGENLNDQKEAVYSKSLLSLKKCGQLKYLDIDISISKKLKESTSLNEQYKTCNITLLPYGMDIQIPNRLQLLTVVNDVTIQKLCVNKYTKKVNDNNETVIVLENYSLMMPNNSFNNAYSIRRLYSERKFIDTKKGNRILNQAKEIELTKEIIVNYTVSQSNNASEYRVNAYFRTNYNNGSKIEESVKSFQTKKPESIHPWLFETYPFSKVSKSGVVYDIRELESKNLMDNVNLNNASIKTLYYVLPEIDAKLSAEDVLIFRQEIFRTEIGDLTPSILTESILDEVLNSHTQDINFYFKLKSLIVSLLQLAKNKGLITDVNIELKTSSTYTPLRNVKNNLKKRCFSHQEFKDLFDICIKRYQQSRTEYLALLMMLLMPLNPGEVCGIKYKDICEKHVGCFSFSVLNVVRKVSNDRNPIYLPLDTVEKYRCIPVPKVLMELIQKQKNHLMEKGYEEIEVNEMPIISVEKKTLKNIFEACSPGNISKLMKYCVKELDIPNLMITVPKNGATKEIDLNYNNHIIWTNLIYYYTHVGFISDELEYILGHKGRDVLSTNYIDYANDYIMLLILIKMERVYYALLCNLDIQNVEYDLDNTEHLEIMNNCLNSIHVSFDIQKPAIVKFSSSLGSNVKIKVVKKC